MVSAQDMAESYSPAFEAGPLIVVLRSLQGISVFTEVCMETCFYVFVCIRPEQNARTPHYLRLVRALEL